MIPSYLRIEILAVDDYLVRFVLRVTFAGNICFLPNKIKHGANSKIQLFL